MDSKEKIENTKKYKLLSHEGLPLSVLFQIKLILSFDLTGTKVIALVCIEFWSSMMQG